MFDHPQTRSGGFLEGVWTVSGECLEGFWEISGRVWNVSGGCLPIIFDPKIILNPKFLWPNIFATHGLHLGFSAKLRIWQVPTCKMEPQSGIIALINHPPGNPATHPPGHPPAALVRCPPLSFTSVLSFCAVSPPLSLNSVRCPHLSLNI